MWSLPAPVRLPESLTNHSGETVICRTLWSTIRRPHACRQRQNRFFCEKDSFKFPRRFAVHVFAQMSSTRRKHQDKITNAFRQLARLRETRPSLMALAASGFAQHASPWIHLVAVHHRIHARWKLDAGQQHQGHVEILTKCPN